MWDESRLICNATEMIDNHNYLVTHFDGKPDTWNAKPPFFIWILTVFIKIFGYNELSVRLPSAISALLTISLMFFVGFKLSKNIHFGLFAGLVLATSGGYVVFHVTRTADYDSFLTLLTTIWVLIGFWYLQINKKPIYIYFISLLVSISVLTKGIQPLILLPGLLLFAIYKRKLLSILKNKHLYFSILQFIFIVGSYYFLRELYNPGYLKEVYRYEIGGHYFQAIYDHHRAFHFYFQILATWGFGYWLFFIPISIWLLIFNRKDISKEMYDFIVLCLIVALSYILIISFGQTKGRHYIAPAMPFLALAAAFPIWYFIDKYILKSPNSFNIKENAYILLIAIALFCQPYMNIINSMKNEVNYVWDKENYGYFMKKCKEYKHYTIPVVLDNAALKFYITTYQKKGYTIDLKDIKSLTTGDTIMACETITRNGLNALYNYQSLKEWRDAVLVKIVSKKEYNAQERSLYYKNLILSNGMFYGEVLNSIKSDNLTAEEIITQKAHGMMLEEMNYFKINQP